MGPVRTHHRARPPLVFSDICVRKPCACSSRTRRSALACFANTPTCTTQPPEAAFSPAPARSARGDGCFGAAAKCASGDGFSAGARGWWAAAAGAGRVDSLGAGAAGGAARAGSGDSCAEAAVGGPSTGGCCTVEASCPGCSTMVDGCACSLACAGALVVPGDGVAPWDSSARSMVYERNGGSSEEEDGAAAWDAGAGLDGPLSSSGTNNTIRTTRMIAPVSRSFTRLSNMGTESIQSMSPRDGTAAPPAGPQGARARSVYPKPLQHRPHRIKRSKDEDAVALPGALAGHFATRLDGGRESYFRRRQLQPLRKILRGGAAWAG